MFINNYLNKIVVDEHLLPFRKKIVAKNAHQVNCGVPK